METLTWFLRADAVPSFDLEQQVWLKTLQAYEASSRHAHVRWMIAPVAGAIIVLFLVLRPGFVLLSSQLVLLQTDRELQALERDITADDSLFQEENLILEGGL